jgi:serine/threonine-protein kinase
VDARADIYSLGATLYHLLTGHTPYSGSSGPIVMSMHLVEPLPDPRRFEPSLTEGVCAVVRKMMAKNRDERYPDVYALDLDLYRLQCGEMPQTDERPTAAPEARARQPASPGYVPAKVAAFDSNVLNRIEDSLAAAVGPMARVLVRKTARNVPTYEALCGELAQQVSDPRARDAFLSSCLRAVRAPTGPGSPGRTTPAPSEAPTHARGDGPSAASGPSRHFSQEAYFGSGSAGKSLLLSEEDLRFVEGELARQIGPLARIVVKRAAKTTGVLNDLIAKLELEIPTDDSRRAFREAMRKHFR